MFLLASILLSLAHLVPMPVKVKEFTEYFHGWRNGAGLCWTEPEMSRWLIPTSGRPTLGS